MPSTYKISDLISRLEELKKSEGDLEVFTTNKEEACFDGASAVMVLLEASTGYKYATIVNNDDVIKPRI